MTEQYTTPDTYCGLTPLAPADVPKEIADWCHSDAVFAVPQGDWHLIYWENRHGGTPDPMPWRAVSMRLGYGMWASTPEATLKSVGLAPSLLDQMRRQSDQPAAPEPQPAPSIRAIGPGWIEAERHNDDGERRTRSMFPAAQAVFYCEGDGVRVVVCGGSYRLTCTPDEARSAIVDAINWPKAGEDNR